MTRIYYCDDNHQRFLKLKFCAGSSAGEFSGKAARSVSLATAFACDAAEKALDDAGWIPETDIQQTSTGKCLCSFASVD